MTGARNRAEMQEAGGMNAHEQQELRTPAAIWRRVGFIAICAAPFLAAIPILIAMAQDGVFDAPDPAWPWLLFGPTVVVFLLVLGVGLLRRQPGIMPALDQTPRHGTVVAHRLQSTGDTTSRRVTTIEYPAADGELYRADLLEELTADSIRALPPGSPVEAYAFQDPQYARTAVFLTEAHDDLMRQGIGSIMWGVDQSARFAGGPTAGSPYVGSDASDVFASPAPAEPAPPHKRYRVSARMTRILVIIAWIIAGLAMIFSATSGFGAFSGNTEIGVNVFIAAFGIALGAMFLDGGTAERRGTLTRWAVLRLIGVTTLAIFVGAIVLLIPAVWGLVRRLTGGAIPRYEQKVIRNVTGLVLSTLLITFAVVGVGRFVWWSPITSTQASSGIGIGETYGGLRGSDALGEVVFVPYKLDGMWSYQSRLAALSLADGALLWDRKIDSDLATGYPVAVTSLEQSGGGPAGMIDSVVVTTEHGELGFYPDDGDAKCAADASRDECGGEQGQGTLAATGEPRGEGFDLYGQRPDAVELTDGNTVLDPTTGEAAGEGFRIEYGVGQSVRIVVDDRVTAELEGVASLQQVLVAPSGTVVLLMSGENNKSMLVIASKDGFQQGTIGDRGLVAWPAWMG